MISGAGAVTDGADRSVRLLTSSSSGSPAATRPGSVAVAVLLLALAGLLLLAGIEATDADDPGRRSIPRRSLGAATADLGERTYSTMNGSLMTDWVETFEDANDNGVEDADEHGVAWFYWLVDPASRRGVTVRSTRSPASIFRFDGSGHRRRRPALRRRGRPVVRRRGRRRRPRRSIRRPSSTRPAPSARPSRSTSPRACRARGRRSRWRARGRAPTSRSARTDLRPRRGVRPRRGRSGRARRLRSGIEACRPRPPARAAASSPRRR